MALVVTVASISLGCSTGDRATAPSSPTPANALAFSGDPGEYVSGGRSWGLSSEGVSFAAASGCSANQIEILVSLPNDLWMLRLAAPAGRSLAPGRFLGAGNWPTQPPQSPGIMLAGNGRACGQSGGEFTITEAQFAPDGSVIRFSASFAQRCVNFIEESRLSTVPWLRGTVTLDSPPKVLTPNLPCR